EELRPYLAGLGVHLSEPATERKIRVGRGNLPLGVQLVRELVESRLVLLDHRVEILLGLEKIFDDDVAVVLEKLYLSIAESGHVPLLASQMARNPGHRAGRRLTFARA